ncbi:MAG: hypothetical protein F9Y92_02860 [Thermoplasmatales archaeon]|nr:hypothetical protein [Thermoplasmatales archaeon]
MNFTIATIISIIPVAVILYDAFGKREDVNDRGIFVYLMLGFFSGIIVSIFFLLLSSSASKYIDLTLFLVLLFPFFTVLLNFIIFNRNRYVKKKGTVHLSFSFGSGTGATFSLSLIYYYGRGFSPSIFDYLVFLLFSFVYVFSFSSAGILIGKGIFEMRRRYNLINAILVMILSFFFLIPYMWSMIIYSTMEILIMVPIYMVLRKELK